jgi:hypothetical protein
VGEPLRLEDSMKVWEWLKEAEKGVQDVLEMLKEGEG